MLAEPLVRRTGAVVLSICALATSTAGQSVSEAWKTGNDRVDRWEGSNLSTPVAARPLEMVSFTEELPKTASFTVGDEVSLSFYLDDPSRHVTVYAREIEVFVNYWMQLKPRRWQQGWNRWGPWPTKEVALPLGITTGNLGLLVRLDDHYPHDGRIAAVLVGDGEATGHYRARFVAGATFAGGTYAVRRGCAGGTPVTSGKIGRQGNGRAFSVDFDLGDNAGDEYELAVTMTRAALLPVPGQSSSTFEHRYCFAHPTTP